MIQQQNYSLSAIAKRDAREDPFIRVLERATETPTVASKSLEHLSAPNTLDEPLDSPTAILQTLYKGVFNKSTEYEQGSFITHKGSLWHCDAKHCGEFDHANFTLAVKKGDSNNVTNAK